MDSMEWEEYYRFDDTAHWQLSMMPVSFELIREGKESSSDVKYTISISTCCNPIELASFFECDDKHAIIASRTYVKEVFSTITADLSAACWGTVRSM